MRSFAKYFVFGIMLTTPLVVTAQAIAQVAYPVGMTHAESIQFVCCGDTTCSGGENTAQCSGPERCGKKCTTDSPSYTDCVNNCKNNSPSPGGN